IVLEKGPDYPYPHLEPFREAIDYHYANPAWWPPADLERITSSGTYLRDLSRERVMRVGGSGTAWAALTMRIGPNDMRTRSRYGFGDDWPIDYDALEPWLCRAEEHLGVSGTDDDNPWAPPRSRPYPLPPFEPTDDDALLGERLSRAGIHLHTTPQARTRLDYRGRPGCMNYGECQVCPIGARYSPNVHLALALATGRCELRTRCSVRRIATDAAGRARAVVCRTLGEPDDREIPADLVVVAAAGIDSARLLLLSRDARHPDGLGNRGGHVGRHLVFHHVWSGHLHYPERQHPGRVGYWTTQSAQFCDPPGRGRHGGVKLEFASKLWNEHIQEAGRAVTVAEAMRRFEITLHCRHVAIHAESTTGDGKRVSLSGARDRFGDPVPHVHYVCDDFDLRTYDYGKALFERVARATGAVEWHYRTLEDFATVAHHMGTCRMGTSEHDSVTDSFGAVHDTP
ncbi:MAG TPA: GMC family oxidoreductase, partial [Dongiaceae bacterium]|nr:GMC family oxidoreductase [Dongiaceae bacterium]